jgi:hypothetical protein
MEGSRNQIMAFQKKIYKKTTDDWCPSYKIKYRGLLQLVSVGYSQCPRGRIGISVFGADDMGMCIYPKTLEEADEIFGKIIDKEFINQSWLDELGFEMF